MRASTIAFVEALLREHLGLACDNLARSAVRLAIVNRMRAVCLDDEENYLALLGRERTELDALTEEVVVPETWFFRDWAPFELVKEFVRDAWRPRSNRRQLRVLSLPCSTGEEPYSVAMALLDVRPEPGWFVVDAVDVSARALAIARQAFYERAAFREKRWTAYQNHFEEHAHRRVVGAQVRGAVRFHRGNALAPSEPWGTEMYDVVLCRNLLIYLHTEAQQRLVGHLDRWLRPGGLLLLGHAEAPQVFVPHYLPAGHARAFAARKGTPGTTLGGTWTRPAGAERLSPPAKATHSGLTRAKVSRKPALLGSTGGCRRESGERANGADNADQLRHAASLADVGELNEAAALCEQVIEREPTSVGAHYLRGLVAAASGDDASAEGWLRKTLYLCPQHADALAHLVLMLEGSGRTEQAAVYRQRVVRTASRQRAGKAQSA